LPFVAADLALRADGTWRVIELGDGQVSDLKKSEGEFGAGPGGWLAARLGGEGADLDQVVGGYPVSAPDRGSLLAVQQGAVPAVAALEVADPALEATGTSMCLFPGSGRAT
jgi:hypothetical protein